MCLFLLNIYQVYEPARTADIMEHAAKTEPQIWDHLINSTSIVLGYCNAIVFLQQDVTKEGYAKA